MFKKSMLLVSTVLGAISLAAPVTAQAGWTHEGAPLSKHVTIELTGEASFDIPSLGSSFGCSTIHAKITIGPAASEVTEYNPTTSSCSGAGPVFSNCVLINDFTTNLPWAVDTSAADMTMTDMTNDKVYSGCTSGIPGSEVKFAEVTTIPDNPEEISSITMNAEQAGVVMTGQFEVLGAAAGTYGIE